MQAKLTLRMDEHLIQRAKAHAREAGKSLSQVVAEYFQVLDGPPRNEEPWGPVTRRLKGSLREVDSTEEDHRRHLDEKHG